MYAYQTSWQGSRSTSSSDTAQSQGFWYGYDEFNRLSSSTSNYGTQQSFTYQYDRYGNRWAQTVTQGSGPSPSLTFNKTNNQISTSGYVYDAAGDLINDGTHSYSYDAEGNLTLVDGGSTATYTYNSLNQRVRIAWSGGIQEIVFGVNGKRTSTWDGNSHALLEGVAYWGGQALEYYANGYAHYLHTNWEGTIRMVTNNTGGVDGEFTSLPFGDAWTVTQGTSNDGYQFAGLDWDSTDIEHAQFRQLSTTQGRWLSPDPYNGSYDMDSPQSFNRYVYVLDNPLGSTDSLGLKDDTCDYDPDSARCPDGGYSGDGVGGGYDGFDGLGGFYGFSSGPGAVVDISISVTTTLPPPIEPVDPGWGGCSYKDCVSFTSLLPGGGGGSGSSGSAPNNFVRMPLPANAQNCSTNTGVNFNAPPGFSVSNIAANGATNGLAGAGAAVGQGGYYDFQRFQVGATTYFYPGYTPVANIAVGAYVEGTGTPQWIASVISNTYAFFKSSNGATALQAQFRNLGYSLAAGKATYSCHPQIP